MNSRRTPTPRQFATMTLAAADRLPGAGRLPHARGFRGRHLLLVSAPPSEWCHSPCVADRPHPADPPGLARPYGFRRVHAELTLHHGFAVGYEQVSCSCAVRASNACLYGRDGGGHRTCPPRSTWRDHRLARAEPDRLWVTHITEYPIREGKVYCARGPADQQHRVLPPATPPSRSPTCRTRRTKVEVSGEYSMAALCGPGEPVRQHAYNGRGSPVKYGLFNRQTGSVRHRHRIHPVEECRPTPAP